MNDSSNETDLFRLVRELQRASSVLPSLPIPDQTPPRKLNIPKSPKVSMNGSVAIGSHLLKMRTSLSLSQNHAAYLAGLHASSLNKIEHGSRALGMQVFSRLTTMYGEFVKKNYPARTREYHAWLDDLISLIADHYTLYGRKTSSEN